MDISIAILHLKNSSTFNLKNICAPDKFELLLSKGVENGQPIKGFLRGRIRNQGDIAGEVLKIVQDVYGSSSCGRALPIPLHPVSRASDIPSTSSMSPTSYSPYSTLYCIPMLDSDLKRLRLPKQFEYESLSTLTHEALNLSSAMAVETRHYIELIDSWLSTQQQTSAEFLKRLFALKPLTSRFRTCVHNPAAHPDYFETCLSSNMIAHNSSSRDGKGLEKAVQKSNAIRAQMIGLEKYNKFLMNPNFNAGPKSRKGSKITDYFAKGNKVIRRLKVEDQKSPSEIWESRYPIHKAAFDDDPVRIQKLLELGHNPNDKDNDSWTALHYCAFYGRLKSSEVLMNHSITDVNAQNKKGETPLHFAALNGYYHLIELMLSNSKIDTEITNHMSLTPLDLCKDNPRTEWEYCAMILRDYQLKKMEVHYGEKEIQHIRCLVSTTAEELRNTAVHELGLSPECRKLFGIWLVSPRLQLQLNSQQTVMTQRDRFEEYADRWGDNVEPPRPGAITENAKPIVCLRRNAHTRIKDEERVVPKCPQVVGYLFSEVMAHFLQGLCPSDEESDNIFFSSIIAMIKFGPTIMNEGILNQILPAHAIPTSKSKRAALISKIEHRIKSFSAKDPFSLQLCFMKQAWTKTWYGCTYFKAIMHMTRPNCFLQVTVGVNDYGLCVINMVNHAMVATVRYREMDPFPELGANSLEFNIRQGTFSFSTPQAKLIDALLRKHRQQILDSRRSAATASASTEALSTKSRASVDSTQTPEASRHSGFRILNPFASKR